MMRLIGLVAGLALLAGCGLKGDLETPPPLWGDPNRQVVERDLPAGSDGDGDRIVFTRDDVDIFQEDEVEEEDPFAEEDEEDEEDDAARAESD
jgi:predicted small lipoprotein YifL